MLTHHLIPNKLQKIVGMTALSITLLGTTILGSPQQARADFCIDVWNDDCDIIPDEYLPEVIPGNDFYNIHVTNKSDRTIWIAVSYYRQGVEGYESSCSTVDGSGENCSVGSQPSEWVTDGYWQLEPGQTAFILGEDARIFNRYIYFHAHTADGMYWGDNQTMFSVNGTLQPFFMTDMGSSITVFTQSFSN